MNEKVKHSSILTPRNIIYVAVIIAIFVSSYLSYLKFTNEHAVCIVGKLFDCGTVLNSVYSDFQGIPIAWIGLAVNIIVIITLLLELRVTIVEEYAAPFLFGLLLAAFVISVYLVYLQAFVIRAYCPWCLSHEALVTVMFIAATQRVWVWFAGADEATATE
jgi:uncharacterized membrane protein